MLAHLYLNKRNIFSGSWLGTVQNLFMFLPRTGTSPGISCQIFCCLQILPGGHVLIKKRLLHHLQETLTFQMREP